MAQLNNNDVRKVYLLAYSQADTERFNCESFAKIVTTAVHAVTTASSLNGHIAWNIIWMQMSIFICVFF